MILTILDPKWPPPPGPIFPHLCEHPSKNTRSATCTMEQVLTGLSTAYYSGSKHKSSLILSQSISHRDRDGFFFYINRVCTCSNPVWGLESQYRGKDAFALHGAPQDWFLSTETGESPEHSGMTSSFPKWIQLDPILWVVLYGFWIKKECIQCFVPETVLFW